MQGFLPFDDWKAQQPKPQAKPQQPTAQNWFMDMMRQRMQQMQQQPQGQGYGPMGMPQQPMSLGWPPINMMRGAPHMSGQDMIPRQVPRMPEFRNMAPQMPFGSVGAMQNWGKK